MPTQEQLTQFEELYKSLQEEYPDTLSYILQVLAWKYVIDGTLETNCSPEDLEKTKERYKSTPQLV